MYKIWRWGLLVAALSCWSAGAEAATITFFNPSQTATPVASGATSDTISSNGYLFEYTRDKLFGGGTGRPVSVSWPDGVQAQGITVAPTGKAQITLSRVDGGVFDIVAFTALLLGNTSATGADIEVTRLLNGQEGPGDPVLFGASGFAGQTFSYTPPATSPLTGFNTYKMSLFVDFALTGITFNTVNGNGNGNGTVPPTPAVPEPGTLTLMGLGLTWALKRARCRLT